MAFLNGKSIIITGASSGIGLELSRQLIKNFDCTVLGIGRSEEKLEKVKKLLGEKFTPFSCDVSKESEWERLSEFIKTQNIKPNIIINNAGIMLPFVKIKDYNKEDFSKILSTNLTSVIYSVQYVLPLLESEKGIINISSSSALCPVIGQGGYCLSKSAVKSFTEVLQTEADFYVGLIMPGFCKTNIMRSIDMSDKDKKLIDKVSISVEKCATKIVKAIDRKKARKVIGKDAKFMNFLYKIAPKKAGKIIAWFLRKSKLKLFEGIQ